MKFENTSVWGFEHALRSMRHPMCSYNRADSDIGNMLIGENDMNLATRLIKSGSEHCKFLRMIHVAVDVNAPRYIWSEWDTYHYNTKNSTSTMHRLLNNTNPITIDLFSVNEEDSDWWKVTIDKLEAMRQEYKEIQSTTKDVNAMNNLLVRAKKMLPEGFMQLRTVDTNYAELRNMYHQRKNHRLSEWNTDFVAWIKTLPYNEFITEDFKEVEKS